MIIIFDHTIENKEEIKERIEQLQSINPLLQQDIKYLDVNYSNQAVWDYDINHLDAFTQDDKRYNQTNPLVKYDSNHLEVNHLVETVRERLQRKLNTIGDWWTIITNHPIASTVEYYEDDYVNLLENNGDKYDTPLDKTYEIEGELVTIKGEDRETYTKPPTHEFLPIFGMYLNNRGVIISQNGLTVEQLVKVYDHEWGHTMIVDHCDILGCAMNVMYEVSDIDLTASFCENCENELIL
jgi:hypothetical protein